MIPDSPEFESEAGSKLVVEDLTLSSDSESENEANNESRFLSQSFTVSIDDFTCSICLDLMFEPISLSCGHSHCRSCLVECAQRGSKRCPSCRSPITATINLFEAPQCVMLARLIQSAFPSVYQKRQIISQTIKQAWKSRFPVCFVDTVLFPHQSMLVHLYEPRYKIMCERLLTQANQSSKPNQSKKFALFSTRFQQSNLDSAVGLIVETSEITRSSNDSYLLYITAVERCEVSECWEEPETNSLFQAQIELVRDDESQIKTDTELIQAKVSAIKSSIECFDTLSESTGTGRSFAREFGSTPADPCELSFWLFSCLLNDRSARGDVSVEHDNMLVPQLLASKSLLWRLERGLAMLNEAIEQLRLRPQQAAPVAAVPRPLQSSAPAYCPMEQQAMARPCPPFMPAHAVTQSRTIPPRQGYHQRLSMRHPPRGYAPRNSRPAWPFASAEQQLRHNQPHRDHSRSFDSQ